MDIQDATDLAQDKDFDLIVVDSIFIVGKKRMHHNRTKSKTIIVCQGEKKSLRDDYEIWSRKYQCQRLACIIWGMPSNKEG